MVVVIEYNYDQVMGCCIGDDGNILKFDTIKEAEEWASNSLSLSWKAVELK